MRLTVVYHRAFWQADGGYWEREGAFSRFVEALAARSDAVELLVPVTDTPAAEGRQLRASNVKLQGLPYWRDLIDFYKLLPGMLVKLWFAAGSWELLIVRLPTPLGFWAWLIARMRRVPTVLIVVGDLAEVAESVPGTSWKRRLYRIWARAEDVLMRTMVRSTLTFANGQALWSKYGQGRSNVVLTTNSTISAEEVAEARTGRMSRPARLLCVSRIDPRKGIRYLPDVIAALLHRDLPVTLTILGGDVGNLGRQERLKALERARELGVEDAITYLGSQTIEHVHQLEREHDVLLVPSLPGEGVPRVIIEAFAAGLPVVATDVAGIPAVVDDGRRGLLVPPAEPDAMARAVERLLTDAELREGVIRDGLDFARSHTIEAQTEVMLREIEERLTLDGDDGRRTTDDGRPASSVSSVVRFPSSPDKLRVNIPLAGMNVSGGVKSLLYLANALARRGHQVRCIVPDYASVSPVRLEDGVDVRVLPSGPWPSAVRKVAYFARLAGEAASDCDLCLANYFLTSYPALTSNILHGNRAALAYNVRGFETISHGSLAEAGGVGRALRGSLAALSYRLPLQKICTTDWLKEMVQDERAIVIGHGIDLDVFRAEGPAAVRDASRTSIGVIGRSGEVKGYPDFLEALSLVHVDAPIEILIAGQDEVPLPDRYLYRRVSTPAEREMAEFYRSCDVFVFPSRAEGFGLPPLEAMACGAAVVLTDCGGVHTYARPDENCLMVPVHDPGAMAVALERILGNAELRQSLVREGFATAARYSRDVVEQRFCALLESLARA